VTATASLGASQARAGGPITLRGVVGALIDDPSLHRAGIGVSVSSAPPATFGALAHFDGLTAEIPLEAFWDSTVERYLQDGRAGTILHSSDQYILTKYQLALDANYAVGRYLWLVTWTNNSVPVGSDVPTAVSAAYHIR
jgi:hypothetical protein